MRKASRKKPRSFLKPCLSKLNDASDTQLLKLLSKPPHSPWPEPKTNPRPRPLRITPRRRYRKPPASSGFFDTLPLELLDMILLRLDYTSLTRLSATNTKAESYIKSRPYYKLVVENCYMFLGELCRIQFLHIPTAASIHHALCNPKCSTQGCPQPAGSFFLLTCQRYCYQCLGTTAQNTALISFMVEQKYHIPKEDIFENLLSHQSSERPGLVFVLEADVICLTTRLFGEERRVTCHDSWWSRDFASLPLPFVDVETKAVEYGRLCRACHTAFEELAHCWEQIDAEPNDDQLQAWRKQLKEMEVPGNRTYGAKQLLQHIRSGECPHAQEYWSKEYRRG
ncbi:hypothetical protein BJY01DRAFT_116677 [Aspergillus pseudoustus]|uniref:F-box domain-containing protein n=1 Tax=Aspergillus pseudoustus TaxID=1810923 RepID=A0ABR4KGR9_9EURO